MSIEIKSPTFPESVADGTIANWVKKEGEQVKQDEVVAALEEVVAPVAAPVAAPAAPAAFVVRRQRFHLCSITHSQQP